MAPVMKLAPAKAPCTEVAAAVAQGADFDGS